MPPEEDAVDKLCRILEDHVHYVDADRSFSLFYSDIGLGFDHGGIRRLYLHYNRETIDLGSPFLELEGTFRSSEMRLNLVTQAFEEGEARFTFCGHDMWMMETTGNIVARFLIGEDDQVFELTRSCEDDDIHYLLQIPNRQTHRDPDRTVPVAIRLRFLHGKARLHDDDALRLDLLPDEDGSLLVAFVVRVLDVDEAAIVQRLDGVDHTFASSLQSSRDWINTAIGGLDFDADDEREEVALARSAASMILNASEAPGYLRGRVASFPSRGKYPCHFLWDGCFHTLALDMMDRRLSPDTLLLLTENLRTDGKMAHFLCSTWMRPTASQPPLVGWFGERICRQRKDRKLAEELLDPLLANNRWWLHQRMSSYGLIYTSDPLETGWDDTPRLDAGPIIPCCMNAYLLLQIQACVYFAEMAGREDVAADCREQAAAYGQRMMEVLYDEGSNIFRDVLMRTGHFVPVETPACFLPLLTDLPLDSEKRRGMIRDHLLDPDRFHGEVPFPSVAYNAYCYQSGGWWRGPSWPPVMYLMLEVLRQHSFQSEWRERAERIYRLIVKDCHMREYFDSESGEGKGAYHQGWTSALLLRLHAELKEAG